MNSKFGIMEGEELAEDEEMSLEMHRVVLQEKAPEILVDDFLHASKRLGFVLKVQRHQGC